MQMEATYASDLCIGRHQMDRRKWRTSLVRRATHVAPLSCIGDLVYGVISPVDRISQIRCVRSSRMLIDLVSLTLQSSFCSGDQVWFMLLNFCAFLYSVHQPMRSTIFTIELTTIRLGCSYYGNPCVLLLGMTD